MSKALVPVPQHWAEDCWRYWGRTLTGSHRHWCVEWDDLPIDATCFEFFACRCYDWMQEDGNGNSDGA